MAYLVNRDAPMGGLSSLMAMKGRMGDTELVHMSKPEVQALGAMGKLHVNPQTGLPEAFGLRDIIPMAATIGGTIFGGPMGGAAGSFFGNLATGRSLGDSAMSGLMSYGLSSLMGAAGEALGGPADLAAGVGGSEAAAAGTIDATTGAVSDGATWSGSLADIAEGGAYDPAMGGLGTAEPSLLNSFEYSPGIADEIQATGGNWTFGQRSPQELANLYGEPAAIPVNPGASTPPYTPPNITPAQTGNAITSDYKSVPESALKQDKGIIAGVKRDYANLVTDSGRAEAAYGAGTDGWGRAGDWKTYAGPVASAALTPPEQEEQKLAGLQRPVAPSYYGSKVAKGGEYKGGPDAQSALDIALGRKRNEQLITPTTFEANPQYGLTGMMATGGAIRKMAQDLQKKGNNGDTILAHINPKEAKMLKAAGGSGTVNPKTGLLQFEDDSSAGDWAGSAGADGEGGGGASMGGGDDTGGTGNDGGASADGMGGYAGGPGPDAGPDGGAPENSASPWSNPDLAEPSLETLSEPGGALGTGGSSAGPAGSWGNFGGGKDGLGTQDVKSLNDYPNKDEAEAPENPGPETSGVSEYAPGFLGHVGDYMRNITYDLRNDPLATMVNVGVALAPGLQGIGLANTASGLAGRGTIGSAVSGYFSPGAQAERDQAKTNADEWSKYNAQMAGAPVASAPAGPGVGFNMGPDGGSSGVQPYYPPRVAQGGGLVSLATGGQIPASRKKRYFEGQVEGNGDGMSDEVPFDIHNSNPDKALLSVDEYVLPADVVSMIGNGSSNAGSKEIDRFVAHIRKKAHGVSKQQKQLKGDKGLRSLVA